MFRLIMIVAVLVSVPAVAPGQSQPPEQVPHTMQVPPELRAWYRNPDGSCVQCSIGMCGIWQNVPLAYTLLWDTAYGPAVRGGSGPSRVETYAARRGMRVYNVTGSNTWEWMQWAAKTGRFAAIGAAANHFQTLYAWDPQRNVWYVCDNNSPKQVDEYTWEEFRRLHLSSGQWVVILDYPPSPAVPRYVQWW